ncbi:MAG: hypothetical protein ACE5JQ_08855 [Candidatus Methylomirabilales bacterium]
MSDRETVMNHIRKAFANVEVPGDDFLQGSFDGCEPYEVVGPFKGRHDWRTVDAEFLDAHYDALNFFSEAGFRFFLPAYLIADLQDKLQTADPVFHLTHGFSDASVEIPTKTGSFVRRIGKSAFVNPRRFGAMTFYDYAQYRLSVFTKEEAQAIVAYLRYKRDADPHMLDNDKIDAALNVFWLDRAANAASAESLKHHVEEETRFVAEMDPHVE